MRTAVPSRPAVLSGGVQALAHGSGLGVSGLGEGPADQPSTLHVLVCVFVEQQGGFLGYMCNSSLQVRMWLRARSADWATSEWKISALPNQMPQNPKHKTLNP